MHLFKVSERYEVWTLLHTEFDIDVELGIRLFLAEIVPV